MNLQGKPPSWPAREKRYDWFRVYNDFVGHPKFRYVARQCEVSIAEASMIALALFVAANKSKPRGWVRDFDPFECSASLDIPMEKVVAVFQKLEALDWISGDYLATWDKRQPDKEDPTSAERQRRHRVKLKEAREGKAQAAPSPPVTPESDPVPEHDAKWLLHSGAQIVVRRVNTLSSVAAQKLIVKWLKEIGNDAKFLSLTLAAADEQKLSGTAFLSAVGQRVNDQARVMFAGPRLQLGLTSVRGGAA